jgi:type I restriction enzyme S subunit
MAGEWPTLSLREASVMLIDCDHRTPSAARAGYPYVAIPQLRKGRIDLSEARRITHEHFVEWTRKAKPSANDVVLSRRCNPGETAFVPPGLEFALGQNLVLLRADGTKVYPPFLRWLVRGPDWWEQIGKFLNVGAVFDSLKCADVPNFVLHIPPMDEQRAIAHILGTLDDKIEMNRRMNETLEAMARALFKSWFVDFLPVRAKAAARTQTGDPVRAKHVLSKVEGAEGRDPGLPKHLADLFPDSFEDSELGEIPKGWRVASLADCVDVVRGLSYKGSGLSDAGVPMHNLNSIYEGGGYKHEGIKHYEGEYKPHHVACAGDLIIANTEQGHDCLLIGYAAIVPARFDSESLFSHHIYRVRPKSSSGLTPDYLCQLLNTSVMHDTVSGYANGTTVNMLPIDGLQSPQVVVPPSVIVRAFNGFAESARKRHEEMIEERHTLAALRDALLQKLLSGEIRVKDAEKFVGSAV